MLGLILNAMAEVLALLTSAYKFIMLARIIVSWLSPDPANPIIRLLYQLTEPILFRVRRMLPRSLFQFGLDISPLIVFIILILFENIAIGGLYRLAQSLSY